MKAFIAQITDKGVFVALEPKPDTEATVYAFADFMLMQDDSYERVYEEWEDNLLRVENDDFVKCEDPQTLELYEQPIIIIHGQSFPIKLSQQVQIELTKDGCKIISLTPAQQDK